MPRTLIFLTSFWLYASSASRRWILLCAVLCVAEYRSTANGLKLASESSVLPPSIFCGSSRNRMGRLALITSMGLRDWKSSSSS